jgi:hypothetical protein
VSLDDPGWGSPLGGSGGDDGWGHSETLPKPKAFWQQPGVLGIGAGVIGAAVVVGVLVLTLGGGSGKKAIVLPPASSARSATSPAVSPSTTPTSTPSLPPVASTSGQTLQHYVAAADAICLKFKPRLAVASNETPEAKALADSADLLTTELQAIERLTSPDTRTAEQEKWLGDATQALLALQSGDVTKYNSLVVAADTEAGNLGMKVCNYGY